MGWLRTMRANPGPLGSASVRRSRSMGNHWMASSVGACSAFMLPVSMPVDADVGGWANAVSSSRGDSGSEMQERCGCLRRHTFSAVSHGSSGLSPTKPPPNVVSGYVVSVPLRLASTKVARRWRQFSLFRAGQPAGGAWLGRLFVEVMDGDKINAEMKQAGNC